MVNLSFKCFCFIRRAPFCLLLLIPSYPLQKILKPLQLSNAEFDIHGGVPQDAGQYVVFSICFRGSSIYTISEPLTYSQPLTVPRETMLKTPLNKSNNFYTSSYNKITFKFHIWINSHNVEGRGRRLLCLPFLNYPVCRTSSISLWSHCLGASSHIWGFYLLGLV